MAGVRISAIKKALEKLRGVKDFDEEALFAFKFDPAWGFEHPTGIEVKFMQGDVIVTLETPLNGADAMLKPTGVIRA